MREIELTNGYRAKVDDRDYAALSGYSWYALKCGKKVYAARKQRGVKASERKTLLMHRVLVGVTDRSVYVDHADHDGLNNQRDNLRVTDNRHNQMNQKTKEGYTSQYKGVHWHKRSKKWRASIRINKEVTYLGVYESEVEAAKAYDAAAIEHFGEFAHVNFKK